MKTAVITIKSSLNNTIVNVHHLNYNIVPCDHIATETSNSLRLYNPSDLNMYVNSTKLNLATRATKVEASTIKRQEQPWPWMVQFVDNPLGPITIHKSIRTISKTKTKRSLKYLSELLGNTVGKLLRKQGYRYVVSIFYMGYSQYAYAVIRGIVKKHIKIGFILGKRIEAHNGCRKPRQKRR